MVIESGLSASAVHPFRRYDMRDHIGASASANSWQRKFWLRRVIFWGNTFWGNTAARSLCFRRMYKGRLKDTWPQPRLFWLTQAVHSLISAHVPAFSSGLKSGPRCVNAFQNLSVF